MLGISLLLGVMFVPLGSAHYQRFPVPKPPKDINQPLKDCGDDISANYFYNDWPYCFQNEFYRPFYVQEGEYNERVQVSEATHHPLSTETCTTWMLNMKEKKHIGHDIYIYETTINLGYYEDKSKHDKYLCHNEYDYPVIGYY